MVTRLMLSCILVVSIRPLLSFVLSYTLHLCNFLYFFSISTYLYISKQKKLRIFGLVNNIWFSNMCIRSTSLRVVVGQRFCIPVVGQLVFDENGDEDGNFRIQDFTGLVR